MGDKDIDGRPIRADGSWHALPEENKGIYEFGWRCSYARKLSYAAQYERAKEQIKLVSSSASSKVDSLQLYYTTAELFYEMENYQIAVENYERANSDFTEDNIYMYKPISCYLGDSYFYLGKYESAINSYEKCFIYSKDQEDWNRYVPKGSEVMVLMNLDWKYLLNNVLRVLRLLKPVSLRKY